jgi:hypothetical protein
MIDERLDKLEKESLDFFWGSTDLAIFELIAELRAELSHSRLGEHKRYITELEISLKEERKKVAELQEIIDSYSEYGY